MALIDVIIPVGPAHRDHVAVALASCAWQSFSDWRAIVINDSGTPLPSYADPRIEVIPGVPPVPGKNRAAVARNRGIQHATAPFVVFLDADDYLLPTGLEILLRRHVTHTQAYTYSSHYALWGDTPPAAANRSEEYDQQFYKKFNIHPITCLIPRADVVSVGGFDEGTPGWEDWTLFLRLAIAGHCGRFGRGPVFVYRYDQGLNHVADLAGGQDLMTAVADRYRNQDGEIVMAGCGCSRGAAEARATATAVVATLAPEPAEDANTLEFIGDPMGSQLFRSPITRREYRAGRNPAVRYIQADPRDVPWLLSLGMFQLLPLAPEFVPPPEPMAVLSAAEEPTPQKRGKRA